MAGKHPFYKAAEKRVGSWLGPWFLNQLLDIGGMAGVYQGTNQAGDEVAIKVLHGLYSVEPTARERFLREGYLANEVGHPGAVHVLDSGEVGSGADRTVYLVMELLRGESLEQRLAARGSLTTTEVLYIADRVLDVLIAAHAKQIVHRDIKPPNIFITETDEVKVLDFGLARVRERTFDASLTRTGMVIGTASYMPPEQARGKRDLVDARSDLWALGATMFKALSGRYVHHAKSVSERLVAAMSKKAPPLASVLPDVVPQVAHVVDRALAYQPSDRWPDAQTMQSMVRGAYQHVAAESIPGVESAPRVGGWTAARRSESSPSMDSLDIHVSVVIDSEDAQSVVVDFADESGRSERVHLRRKSEQPPVRESDDEISEVSVVDGSISEPESSGS